MLTVTLIAAAGAYLLAGGFVVGIARIEKQPGMSIALFLWPVLLVYGTGAALGKRAADALRA